MLPARPSDVTRMRNDASDRMAGDAAMRLFEEAPPEFIDFLMELLTKYRMDHAPQMNEGVPPLPFEHVSMAGPKGMPGTPPPGPDPHLSNLDQIIKRGR